MNITAETKYEGLFLTESYNETDNCFIATCKNISKVIERYLLQPNLTNLILHIPQEKICVLKIREDGKC